MPIVMITVDHTLVDTTVRMAGDSVDVSDQLASWLLKHKLASLSASPAEAAAAAASDLGDLPGAEALQAAGLQTRAALIAYINEHGDSWFAPINGIGKATASQIIEELQASAA